MQQYPVNLNVAGRRVLVVGAGRVAARKIESLVACGALVDVVAPEISEDVRALGVACEQREYVEGDARHYRLVVTATGDPTVDGAVFADAEAAGVWVNSADDPEHCTFTLPAVVRRGPLLVTVSTSGQSPAMATWLRRRFEGELGPEFEVLLELVAAERQAIKATGRSTEELDWQRALDSVMLDGAMLDLIRAGNVDRARERLQACLSSS
jgi:siroheme synthase-like protein